MKKIVNMEISKEKFLKERGEEGKQLRAAFRVGYWRGLFIAAALVVRVRKRELDMNENEKHAFLFGESCGVASIITFAAFTIWIFVGG